jgi:hypothetical protein
MPKVNFKLNNKEYFPITRVSFAHKVSRSIAIKTATINCISGSNFRDFELEMDRSIVMLGSLYIDDELYMQGFVSKELYNWSSTTDGTTIEFRLFDRFVGLIASDVITSRPNGSMQMFLSNILTELGYVANPFINTYEKKIKTAKDFISTSGVDINKPLKTVQKTSLVEEDTYSLLGEYLGINKVLLVSNGYDTLSFEKASTQSPAIFDARRYMGKDSNILNISKDSQISDGRSLTPSIIYTLNSYRKQAKKDSKDSVNSFNPYGIPHIVKIHRVAMEATYEEISSMMDFSFAGVKARSNSYSLKINALNDSNKNFFRPNTSITVFDEVTGINAKMMILDASTTVDAESGTETQLSVSYQESFQDNVSIKNRGILRQ